MVPVPVLPVPVTKTKYQEVNESSVHLYAIMYFYTSLNIYGWYPGDVGDSLNSYNHRPCGFI